MIDALVEHVIPVGSGTVSAQLIDQSQLRLERTPPASVTINLNPQLIEMVNGVVMKEVRGNVNLPVDGEELLRLVGEHGGKQSTELASAVHELSDEGIPKEKRLSAGQRLKGFLFSLAPHASNIGTAVLQKYIERQLGL